MKKKSTKANIHRKEELICADKVKVITNKAVCQTTGSAVVLTVLTKKRQIDIHLTDVALVKLQENIKNLTLNRGEQVAHES